MNFSEFCIKLTNLLQENKEKAIFPQLHYKNNIYAINEKGEFYNKNNNYTYNQEQMLNFFQKLFNNGKVRLQKKEVFEI
jgi:hypothetical protein